MHCTCWKTNKYNMYIITKFVSQLAMLSSQCLGDDAKVCKTLGSETLPINQKCSYRTILLTFHLYRGCTYVENHLFLWFSSRFRILRKKKTAEFAQRLWWGRLGRQGAICWLKKELSMALGTWYFFRNKTLLFVKIEIWNSQHLFDI